VTEAGGAHVPCRERDVPGYDFEADVVVVGLGLAGACAALEARRAGSDVLVLERAGGGGGTSALSGGLIYLGGGTPVQMACGYPDTPEQMFRFLAAASQPGADEEKIRLFCEGSVEHFHWFEGLGIPFARSFHPEPGMEPPTDDGLVFSGGEDCHPWSGVAQPAPRAHKPRARGKAGPFLMRKVLEAVAREGLRIEADARVEALVRAEADGRVVGARLRRAGRLCFARARRGVVLCAGGFVLNDAMLARHAPMLLRCNTRNATPGDDGAGIRMGQAAGGEVARMGQGLRFINEDTYYGHIGVESLYHQEGQVHLLLDDASFERGLLGQSPRFVAESVAALEAEAGFPPGALQATVALYNRYAERGEDPLFHKRRERLQPLTRPPYALLDASSSATVYATFTLGGLDTDADGRVRTPDGAVLPGLYAAGRTAALFCGSGYPASGISLADASFFGRRAGRAAARARREPAP
jgi:3-oxo-5alpha-steroid 4-dehydrogenase